MLRKFSVVALLGGTFLLWPLGTTALQSRMTTVAVPEIRQSDSSGIVADVDSRLKQPGVYRDADPITWVHEGTHGINSQLRQTYGCSAFYLLDGAACLIQYDPQVTLAQVAAAIPEEYRGPIFSLYLKDQQRYWNDEPLYLCDELACYVNGSVARHVLGITSRYETVEHAWEMLYYCRVLESMAPSDELNAYLDYQQARLEALGPVQARRSAISHGSNPVQ